MIKLTKENLVLLICSLVILIIAFFPVSYGYFCDELYYIALSKNIAFGYVDVPPLLPFFLATTRFLFGESIAAIHILPALIGIVILILTRNIVQKMGGGFFAQTLTLIAFTLSPINVALSSVTNYDAFNRLFWALAIYSIVQLLLTENKKYWIYFGIAAGFGLMSKFDILWLGVGVTGALFFTSQRKYFCSYQFWLGGVIALLITAPYLIWIVTHDFLTIEYFVGYANALKGPGVAGFWELVKDQLVVMSPVSFPIWALGLYYFLFNKEGRKFRLLGLAYIVTFVFVLATHAKFYLITPFYFVLLAGGAIFLEKILQPNLKVILVKSFYFALIIITGFALVPYYRPVLPVDLAVKYIKFLDKMHVTIRYDVSHILPQWLADDFGWEEMAAEVARIYYSLPLGERKNTVIFTNNYSEASAIYFYSEKYKLPIPISGHDQYYVWGPRNLSIGSNMIVVGYCEKDLPAMQKDFLSVQKVGNAYNKYIMPHNNGPIYLGREFKHQADVFWPKIKKMTM